VARKNNLLFIDGPYRERSRCQGGARAERDGSEPPPASLGTVFLSTISFPARGRILARNRPLRLQKVFHRVADAVSQRLRDTAKIRQLLFLSLSRPISRVKTPSVFCDFKGFLLAAMLLLAIACLLAPQRFLLAIGADHDGLLLAGRAGDAQSPAGAITVFNTPTHAAVDQK
jgi:hypothetical protein